MVKVKRGYVVEHNRNEKPKFTIHPIWKSYNEIIPIETHTGFDTLEEAEKAIEEETSRSGKDWLIIQTWNKLKITKKILNETELTMKSFAIFRRRKSYYHRSIAEGDERVEVVKTYYYGIAEGYDASDALKRHDFYDRYEMVALALKNGKLLPNSWEKMRRTEIIDKPVESSDLQGYLKSFKGELKRTPLKEIIPET